MMYSWTSIIKHPTFSVDISPVPMCGVHAWLIILCRLVGYIRFALAAKIVLV